MSDFSEQGGSSVIARALSGDYDRRHPQLSFKDLPRGFSIRRPDEGEAFILSGLPISKLHILLRGSCSVIVFGKDGGGMIADVLEAVQVFGLTEVVRGVHTYGATVEAGSGVALLEFSVEAYERLVSEDPELCRALMRYLAKLAVRNMDKTEQVALLSPRDTLGAYFYECAAKKQLPCIIPVSRKQMSEELHINLRTLYRYIDGFKADGAIYILRGKIAINKDGFQKLKADYGD